MSAYEWASVAVCALMFALIILRPMVRDAFGAFDCRRHHPEGLSTHGGDIVEHRPDGWWVNGQRYARRPPGERCEP